jgi:hypothetical protein
LDIRILVNAASKADRIPADEPAIQRIIEASPVVVQAGFSIILSAGGEFEGLFSPRRVLNQ